MWARRAARRINSPACRHRRRARRPRAAARPAARDAAAGGPPAAARAAAPATMTGTLRTSVRGSGSSCGGGVIAALFGRSALAAISAFSSMPTGVLDGDHAHWRCPAGADGSGPSRNRARSRGRCRRPCRCRSLASSSSSCPSRVTLLRTVYRLLAASRDGRRGRGGSGHCRSRMQALWPALSPQRSPSE